MDWTQDLSGARFDTLTLYHFTLYFYFLCIKIKYIVIVYKAINKLTTGAFYILSLT